MRNMNQAEGMDVTVKRRLPDGQMFDVSPKELNHLSTKAKMATTAQALKEASQELRNEWALEMRSYANDLYSEGRYEEAMQRYLEALMASDFGRKKPDESTSSVGAEPRVRGSDEDDWTIVDKGINPSDQSESNHKGTGEETTQPTVTYVDDGSGNVDLVVVPSLTNLAACCIQLQQWGKAIQFCEQALVLRPQCAKALMRMGIAYLQIGEFRLAKEKLMKSLECPEQPPQATDSLSNANENAIPVLPTGINPQGVMYLRDADKQRIRILLSNCQAGLAAEKHMEQKRKEKMRAAFTGPKGKSKQEVTTCTQTSSSVVGKENVTERLERGQSAPKIDFVAHLMKSFMSLWLWLVSFFAALLKRKGS